MNSRLTFSMCLLLIVVGLSVLGSSGVAAVKTAEPEADLFDRFGWKGKTGDARVVRISNAFGDVRLRHGGDAGELEVAAVSQQLRKDGVSLKVRVEEVKNELVVRVEWSARSGEKLAPRPEGDRSRTDLAVLVPSGTDVVVRASGLVEARGVRGDIDVFSAAGPIRVNGIFGSVNARTDSGEINVGLVRGETDQEQIFRSVTGPIEVWVSSRAEIRARLETSGTITSDFTMEVEHRDHEEPDKVASVAGGENASRLVLTSRRGNLALRRVVGGR